MRRGADGGDGATTRGLREAQGSERERPPRRASFLSKSFFWRSSSVQRHDPSGIRDATVSTAALASPTDCPPLHRSATEADVDVVGNR